MHPTAQTPQMLLSGPVDALLRALDELRHVCDPEVGENILDLGLVESLQLANGEAVLRLVGTGATCPLSDLNADEALRAIQRALPDTDIYVTHDPSVEWSLDRVRADMRARLGWATATG